MWLFLIPLLLSFACHIGSTFTAAYARRLGPRGGQITSAILRDALGLPLLGLGYGLAALQPGPRLLNQSPWFDLTGWTLIAAGAALIIWAQAALDRRALAPAVSDTVVRRGPYTQVRHPLYDGVLLEVAGVALVLPTAPIALSGVLALAWLLVQARAEEHDLLQRSDTYAGYMGRVPRFLPRPRQA